LGTHAGRFFLRKRSNASSERFAKSGLHQRARDVRPAGRFAIGQRKNGFGLRAACSIVDARHHFADAVLADGLELGDFHQQLLFCVSRK
jgi:hypothetical protein